MTAVRCRILWSLCLWVLALVSSALAQGESSSVTGMGTVEIKRAPSIMRMEVILQAKGATTEEALKALNERLEAARLTVQSAGADKKSVVASEPALVSEEQDQQRQMQMRMFEQMRRARGGGRAAEKPKLPSYVTLTANITAEWSLKGKTADELLIESTALQQKIREADLAGSEEAVKLSPEEQEIMEELESTGYTYDSSEAKPGEPMFVFVSRISEDEYNKALADAFQKAKQKASALASAAGAELGELRSLADQSQPGGDDEGYGYQYMRQYALLRAMQGDTPSDVREAIGQQPTKVTYQVGVTANFGLK